jgi:isoleucyl-tRNA synthetase
VLSELALVTAEVTAALEEFDTAAAGRRLAAFVDDLSNWYVRRSRRRFWDGPGTPDGAAAFATLYQCLQTLTRLMAPMVPFLTDYVWGILRGPEDPDSVHLTTWPDAGPGLVDRQLSEQMGLARRLVELGRSARAAASLGIRQPLPRALVGAAGFAGLPAELRDQVAGELNVRALDALSTVADDLVDHVVKPNFRTLGRRFGNRTQVVAAAITGTDPATLAGQLQGTGEASVLVDGEPVALGPDDVIVTQTPRAGWSVASDAGETVALELDISPELRREGLAREVIRLVQDARKADGLEVSDRITLRWSAPGPELAAALTEHGQLIAGEVLATEFGPGAPDGGAAQAAAGTGHSDADLGLTFWIRRS